MQWLVLNAFGALSWLAGLSYAKGMTPPIDGLLAGGDHRLLIGMSFSLTGLVVLLYANLRTPA